MSLVHIMSPSLDYVVRGTLGGPWRIDASAYEAAAWKKVKRAIFVFSSDPCRQLHSQFRRTGGGHQSYNMINMQKRLRAPMDIARAQIPHDNMHDYVAGGRDTELLEEQFDAWTTLNRSLPFPVLALHIDEAKKHAQDIAAFMGLPPSAAFTFPAFRARTALLPEEAKDVTMCQQSGIYSSLEGKVEAVGKYKVLW